jgi:hypothetical protein
MEEKARRTCSHVVYSGRSGYRASDREQPCGGGYEREGSCRGLEVECVEEKARRTCSHVGACRTMASSVSGLAKSKQSRAASSNVRAAQLLVVVGWGKGLRVEQ